VYCEEYPEECQEAFEAWAGSLDTGMLRNSSPHETGDPFLPGDVDKEKMKSE
jgi:hypothetical protein